MAKISTDFSNLFRELDDLQDRIVPISKMGVFDGSSVIIEAIRSATPKDTGDLRESLGISRIASGADGVHSAIGYSGYDRKGVSNQLKARVLEFGRSGRNAHPFIRTAVRRARQAVEAAIASRIEGEIQKITGGK